MSGHSKWSTIKHKKAATDAKRGKVFTKIIKELTIAARLGGGDPDGNPRLRSAIASAKGANMPSDNMKRAIQKGTGELPGVTYEEINYEAYGPGGVAVYIECLTDNKMRTTPEIRHILSKHGGTLAEPGSVAWMFEKRGNFVISAECTTEEQLMDIVLEAGADDLTRVDDTFEVQSPPEAFNAVIVALEEAEIVAIETSIDMEPSNVVHLDGKKAEQCIKLLEVIEEHEDVQKLSANLDFDESELD
jgi:YebC/PmpR family DNA-binding regulatory protein